MYSLKVDKSTGVQYDQIGKMTGYCTVQDYPEKLRKINFYDKDIDRTQNFLSNNFDLASDDIALLYKNRWQAKLFFKWINKHLKIKAFWVTQKM